MRSRSSSQNSGMYHTPGEGLPALRGISGMRGGGGGPHSARSNTSSGSYFGYSSKYPNPNDELRAQRRAEAPPPKFEEKPLHPQHLNYRGHSKCKFCSKFVTEGMLDEHYEECPLVTMRCELRDTETDEPCFHETRGRKLMTQHQLSCPMRTEVCDNRGCGEEVSIRSKKFHLGRCNYLKMTCPTCGIEFQRNELMSHEGCCPEASVQCPLNCGESMRQGDLVFHLQNTATQHVECVRRGASRCGAVTPSDPQSVYEILVNKIVELETRLELFANSPRRSPSRSNSLAETPFQDGSGPPRSSSGGGETQPRHPTPRSTQRRSSGGAAVGLEEAASHSGSVEHRAADNSQVAPAAEDGFTQQESAESFHAGGSPLNLDETVRQRYIAPVDQLRDLPSNDRPIFIQEEFSEFQLNLTELQSGLAAKSLSKNAGRVQRQNLVDRSSGLKELVDECEALGKEEDERRLTADQQHSAVYSEGSSGSSEVDGKATIKLLRRKMSRLDRTWCSLQIDLYNYLFH